jgi:hypothetical protein
MSYSRVWYKLWDWGTRGRGQPRHLIQFHAQWWTNKAKTFSVFKTKYSNSQKIRTALRLGRSGFSDIPGSQVVLSKFKFKME